MVMQAQSKDMKLTWSTSSGGGAGHIWFQGAKNCLAKYQDLNTLVASAVQEVLKQEKRARYTATQ